MKADSQNNRVNGKKAGDLKDINEREFGLT